MLPGYTLWARNSSSIKFRVPHVYGKVMSGSPPSSSSATVSRVVKGWFLGTISVTSSAPMQWNDKKRFSILAPKPKSILCSHRASFTYLAVISFNTKRIFSLPGWAQKLRIIFGIKSIPNVWDIPIQIEPNVGFSRSWISSCILASSRVIFSIWGSKRSAYSEGTMFRPCL